MAAFYKQVLAFCPAANVPGLTANNGRLMALGTACFRSNDVIAGGHTLTEAEALRGRRGVIGL
ncbi:hypothetical protein LBMAG49_17150 [Planctomycetota bacterium]|nr:hypothetical protein LBMAG49_17150 [Planctomycetota bacterium]